VRRKNKEVPMPVEMLGADAQLRIAKPAAEVFDAIVNPEQMSRYFISSGSDRLDAGVPVTWRWADYGAECTVTPQEIVTDQSVSFLWAASGEKARVVFQLESDGADATVVKVSESGWPGDTDGIARCMQQTRGWMHMLCCMKAYLEYGINLRAGGVVKDSTG